MSAFAPLLARLRRSGLGAWLAAFYGLAVLAAGLAPTLVLAAHPALAAATLCSGQPAADPESPQPQQGQLHCQGCPANPVVAAPPGALQPASLRIAVTLAQPAQHETGVLPGIGLGLPQSRAPPARS
ncbi:hypothetical protein [Bosea sp. (in: a-proteobacteria)]|jgi:hypothetical protein|uniref:hypothetical protein n=1 Tax=Bosea sp. (in: a-proteobacteria) TaxID=1871050 RepID=UPI003F6FAC96